MRNSSKLVLVCIIALSWMQAAIAAHQFQHDLDSASESCGSCAQLDRFDELVLEPSQSSLAELTHDFVFATTTPNYKAGHVSHFSARAPPHR